MSMKKLVLILAVWVLTSQPFSLAQPLSSRSVEVASRYFGERERQPNRSPQIDAWERPFGLRGQSWCMMFQWNMEDESANRDNYRNPLLKTPLCWKQVQYAKRITSKIRIVYSGIAYRPMLRAGWLGFTSAKGNRTELLGQMWSGHVFRVREDSPAGADNFVTVEGNYRNMVTNVYRKKSKTLCFVRPL